MWLFEWSHNPGAPHFFFRVRDAPRRQKKEVSVLWVVIIILPEERESYSFKHTLPHHTPPLSSSSLHSNMHLGLLLLFLSLTRSCRCAPQQTCQPGDEFLGKVTSTSTSNKWFIEVCVLYDVLCWWLTGNRTKRSIWVSNMDELRLKWTLRRSQSINNRWESWDAELWPHSILN